MLLPLALIGVVTVLLPATDAVPQVDATPTAAPNEVMMGRLVQTTRELDRVSATLLALSVKDSRAEQDENVIVRATRTLEGFNEMADRARREAVQLSLLSRQTSNVTQSGQQAIEQAISSITFMQEQIGETVVMLTALAQNLRRVSEINTAINEIATQSNFLALNAAIEAARAGAQGRSFATIAEEVRVLSEQSSSAVSQVRDILTQIHKTMERTVDTVQAGAESVETGSTMTRQARETISQLVTTLSTSNGVVQKILAAVDQQSSGIESLVMSINSIGQTSLQHQANLRIAETVARDLDKLSVELNTAIAEIRIR
jgi:methyl-accepting chemotaxis protein